MSKVKAITQAYMMRELVKGCTAEQLADATGLTLNTVYIYIRTFRRQKVVYVSKWVTKPGDFRRIAVWKLRTCLSEQDAPRPPKLTSTERHKRYIARMVEERVQADLADRKAKGKVLR